VEGDRERGSGEMGRKKLILRPFDKLRGVQAQYKWLIADCYDSMRIRGYS
jgi:hypothetical protein